MCAHLHVILYTVSGGVGMSCVSDPLYAHGTLLYLPVTGLSVPLRRGSQSWERHSAVGLLIMRYCLIRHLKTLQERAEREACERIV